MSKLTAVQINLWLTKILVALCCAGCLSDPQPTVMLAASPTPFSFEDSQLVPELEAKPPAIVEPTKPSPGGDTPDANARATEPQPPKLALALVYGPPGCEPCLEAVAALNDSKRYKASKSDITPAVAKIANEWNQGAYPIVIFRDKKNAERFVCWRGLSDFETRYNRTMGIPKTAAADTGKSPSSASGSTAAALYYHGQSSSWTWPGNLRRHLVTEHGYSANQVAAMSDAQVIAAHDAAHNGTTMRAQAPRRHKSRANCPTGGAL